MEGFAVFEKFSTSDNLVFWDGRIECFFQVTCRTKPSDYAQVRVCEDKTWQVHTTKEMQTGTIWSSEIH
jgi:hypothetical protein